MYVAPIGQNLATASQNYQSTFGTNTYESLSSSFHTQLNQAPFLVNDHPTLTRAKTEKSKPKAFIVHSEPTTTKQTLAQSEWFQAMRTEYDSLIKNGTWVLTALPPDIKLIWCKWIFKVKENPDQSINKYKAWLLDKGFQQQYGFDFHETFLPVVKLTTIRIILTIFITCKWEIKQVDVNNLFLNGDLQEEAYMQQTQGFLDTNSVLVCQLKTVVYGLKQSPHAWYEKLHQVIL